jgi:hypothetical protein
MKDGNIYIYEKIGNIPSIIGVCYQKEKFINKSFTDKYFILLALNQENRKEIPLELINNNQLKKITFTINDFTKEYILYIHSVHQYEKNHDISFSWLEVIQLAYLLKNFQLNIEESLKTLKNFYLFLEENF